VSEPGVGQDIGGPSLSSEVELTPAVRGQLLDPSLWQEGLERYALATNLAVTLTDADGRRLGACLNPRPTWSRLHAHGPARAGACPFSLMPTRPCTCVADALARGSYGLTRDRAGLVHFAVPLRLGDHRLGALVAGQVFDQYPEQLVLEHVAKLSGLPPQEVWQRARLEHPVKEDTLRVYADLLATLADDRLRSRYHAIREAGRLAELAGLSDQLRRARDELEARVRERTVDLARANEALKGEIAERRLAEAARTELLRCLVTAQEDERRRVSRELHDLLGQDLTALILGLKALEAVVPEEPLGRRGLREMQEIVGRIGREVHDLAVELRPTALDDLGLHAALDNYVERWSVRAGIAVDLHCSGLDAARLTPAVETTIYRVVQEALNNVLKHARADRVSVIVERRDGHAIALVEDDGQGFTPEESGELDGFGRRLGLLGMRERVALVGGALQVESSSGAGTTVRARIPLPQDREEPGRG